MGAAYFYHLTRSTLEATLPPLLAKARGAGWRVAVRGVDPERLDWLDERLWLNDGFLAHGRDGGDHDADQPILLTTSEHPANAPECVMSIDGAEIGADEVSRIARACILFDGNDDSAVDVARDQWRRITASGVAAQYWSQDGGAWTKKAEHGG